MLTTRDSEERRWLWPLKGVSTDARKTDHATATQEWSKTKPWPAS